MQNPSALSWTCLDGTSDRQEPAICSFDDVELHRYVVASDPPPNHGHKGNACLSNSHELALFDQDLRPADSEGAHARRRQFRRDEWSGQ